MIQEYQTQNELNPKIWDGDQLKPSLRLKLLKIAQYFYEFLGIDAPIKGVILTGSNVNYNWTDTSDIDLHVLINYKDVNDSIPFVREYMMAKKSIWNNTYPLQYKGMPIELYAQDENEPHASTGVYCLSCDKWLKQPSPEQVSIDDVEIDRKADPYKFEIDNLQADDPQLEMKIKSLKKRLKRMRQTGLEASGEYSVENLAFKTLRNSGHLAKLNDLQQGNVMSSLALEASVDEVYADSGLGKWFGKGKKGGVGGGGWDRYDAQGNRVGKCGDAKEGDAYSACLSKGKAEKLGKDGRAEFVRRKRDAQRKAGDSKKGGERKKGQKPTKVKTENFADGKNPGRKGLSKRFGISQTMSIADLERIAKNSTGEKRRMAQWNLNMKRGRMKKEELEEQLNLFLEKNVPNDASKWSYAKSQAKKKFDVYPSAYANAWASKKYKELGGTWRKSKK